MLRPTILSLLAVALLAGACTEDDDGVELGPGGDTNGTWVVQRSSGTTYVRVLPSAVEMYVQTDTCFLRYEYVITDIEGSEFTLQQEGVPETSWTIERAGSALTVQTSAEVMTLEAADLDLGTLQVCGGPEGEFPHPPCGEIPSIDVGGSITNALGEGDTRWSDGSWFDIWSLQLDAASTVTISLTADDPAALDTYLMLYDASAVTRLAENDDVDYDGGVYDSRIDDLALDAGCYIIVANSYSGDDAGEVGGGYSLSVQ